MYDAVKDIIDRARFELPGATDATIMFGLFDAMNEWCRRTDANRDVIEVTLLADTRYYVMVPDYTVIVRVWNVAHREMPVSATYDADRSELVLTQVPLADDLLTPMIVEASFAPKPGATDPDDWMSELQWIRYHAVILDGVIAKMTAQVAKPYSNQTKAMFHGRRFRNGMASSKAQSDVGNQANGQGWHFPVIK